MKWSKQARVAAGLSTMIAACASKPLMVHDGDPVETTEEEDSPASSSAEDTVRPRDMLDAGGSAPEASAPAGPASSDAGRVPAASPSLDAGRFTPVIATWDAGVIATPECISKYSNCLLEHPGDLNACAAQAAACGLPTVPIVTPTFAYDAGCPNQDACAAVAVAITAEAVGLATGIVGSVTSGVSELLGGIGGQLGISPITDLVNSILGTVTPIVRCATFTDYLRCVEQNPDHVENCAGAAQACGFNDAAPGALAAAAKCSSQLSQCATVDADCVAKSAACARFDTSDVVRGVAGISSKAIADIFDALTPLVQCEGRQDARQCKCSLEFAQCRDKKPAALDECSRAVSACLK